MENLLHMEIENAKEAIQWLYFGYLGAVKEQNGAANSIGRISSLPAIILKQKTSLEKSENSADNP